MIERERKYEVGPDFTVPDLAQVPEVAAVAAPRTYRLSATYFDTPGLRLVRARITLRRRTGGSDAGWHLKLPAGADRREVHAPLGRATDTVPGELAGLVAQHAGGEPLRPVARLRTTRVVRNLTGADGRVLAEVADDRVRGELPAGEPGGWRVTSSWREVEVELVTGPAGLLAAVGDRLRQAGAAPSAAPSKLSRVLTESGMLPG